MINKQWKKLIIIFSAIHVKALVGNEKRRNGECWLIQKSDCESFLPDVHEEIIQHTHIITLNSRQYAVIHRVTRNFGNKPATELVTLVIHDPVELVDGKMKNKLGQKDLRKGECNFFLHPGESIPEGIEDVIVLGENEGIVIVADEEFVGTA